MVETLFAVVCSLLYFQNRLFWLLRFMGPVGIGIVISAKNAPAGWSCAIDFVFFLFIVVFIFMLNQITTYCILHLVYV